MIGHPVGEAPHANPDPLQHTVAGQLVQHQARLDDPGLFVVVGYDAADKVGLGRVQRVHEGVELLSVEGGDGLGATPLLLLALALGVVGVLLLPALTAQNTLQIVIHSVVYVKYNDLNETRGNTYVAAKGPKMVRTLFKTFQEYCFIVLFLNVKHKDRQSKTT